MVHSRWFLHTCNHLMDDSDVKSTIVKSHGTILSLSLSAYIVLIGIPITDGKAKADFKSRDDNETEIEGEYNAYPSISKNGDVCLFVISVCV